MRRFLPRLLLLVLTLTVFSAAAFADDYPVGVISLDQTGATSGEFDITNYTGVNSLPPDLPVTTDLTINISTLIITFASGPAEVLTAGDFTSDLNGGWLGNNSFNIASDPIISAVLTGTLGPTTGVDVFGVGTISIAAAFDDGSGTSSVTLSDPAGALALGDLADINAVSATAVPTPEPGTGALLGVAFAGIVGSMLVRRRRGLPGQGSLRASQDSQPILF
jgi:hypothetical protein